MGLRYACGAIVAVWASLALAGVAGAGGDPGKGEAIYNRSCATCHGSTGQGDGPVGTVITPRAADFTSAASRKKSEAQLRTVIEQGAPNTAMVGWKGDLSDGQIDDVLAYVLTLRKQ